MKFRSLVSALLVGTASARLAVPQEQEHRQLQTVCKRQDDGFTRAVTMNAPLKLPQTMEGAKSLYEMARDGDPFPECGDPGQNESFQGTALINNKGECQKVNICHGNAGFGWNRITVDRDAIGVNNNGQGGHAKFEHNDPSKNKRNDYFPSTTSVPNPNGAGINGALDSNCGFVCDPTDTTCDENGVPQDVSTTDTSSSTTSDSSSSTSSAEETFSPGETVTDGNGEECVLETDCSCTPVAQRTSAEVPSGTKGDPHFIMWNGAHFDFHGGCDLVLVDVPGYNHGQGLKIHVRTKVETWYSYVERVAVQIGEDVLEVKGGFSKRRFILNGSPMATRKLTQENGVLPFTVGGNPVHYLTQKDHVSWKVSIHLPDGQFVSLRTIKDWMRVDIENPLPEYFGSAKGLMGPFKRNAEEDQMLGRDGASIMEDPILFGQEWQVQGEPSLFMAHEGVPQFPQTCEMPVAERSMKRLLGESDLTYDMAEQACEHLPKDEVDDCIYDVIASSDMDIAGAY